MPHYLRFVCALAMVSATQGCYRSHELTDAGVTIPGRDAFVSACDQCRCPPPFDPIDGRRECDPSLLGERHCCPIVGPLSPPDLPA
jgi:hypothetical protein